VTVVIGVSVSTTVETNVAAAAVIVVWVMPMQEHALLYAEASGQYVAYAGTSSA
jgi:hypothetical protein